MLAFLIALPYKETNPNTISPRYPTKQISCGIFIVNAPIVGLSANRVESTLISDVKK